HHHRRQPVASQRALPRCRAGLHRRPRGAGRAGHGRDLQRGRRRLEPHDRGPGRHGGRDRRRRPNRAAAGRERPAGLSRQLREDPPGAGLRARVDGGRGHPRSGGGRACRAGAPRLPESRLPQRPGAAPDARDAAPPAGGLDRGTRAGVRLSNTPPGMARSTTDFLVVGGGILGLTLALELKRRHGDCSVTLLEKERACVLHAGFYYTADTLKARLTREGNRRLAAYCVERGLALDRCGKLVVARDAADLPGLEELERRGRANGVALELLSADDAHRLEPRARTYERALFSPSTTTVQPAAVVASLVADARAAGI